MLHMPESKILHSGVNLEFPENYTLTEFVLSTEVPYSDKNDLSREAFIDCETESKITHFEFRKQIDQVASGLINKYHLVRGDVIALFSYNHINFATVLLAALSVGIIVTTINPMYTEREVFNQLEDSNAKLIITVPSLLEVSKKAVSLLNKKVDFVSLDDEYSELKPFLYLLCSEPYDKLVFKKGECKETTATIAYSSGTTGQPKGVLTTHYNYIVDLMQIEYTLTEDDGKYKRFLGLLPFFHMYGIVYPILQGVHRHITIVVMKHYEFSLLLKTIEKFKIDFLNLAPPVALMLAKHSLVDDYDLSSLKKLMSAASSLPYEVSKMVTSRLNCKLIQGYGMTEASPVITIGDDMTPMNTVGRLVPNIFAKIVDPNTNKILNYSQTGELWVKGPNIMKGYLNNEKATREMFDNEGFMRTGDIGFFDKDKYLHIVDRVKELIKYKGYQIAPAELERALLTHPEVKDCCVIGVYNEVREELPKAFVVLTESSQPTSERFDDIKNHVHKLVAPYKYLRGGLEAVDTIPKSTTGKILRRVLRDQENQKSKYNQNSEKGKQNIPRSSL